MQSELGQRRQGEVEITFHGARSWRWRPAQWKWQKRKRAGRLMMKRPGHQAEPHLVIGAA